MGNKKENVKTPENIEAAIVKMGDEAEQGKEDKLINLIIEIVVSSTLKEYYETSNKISQIQSNRAE